MKPPICEICHRDFRADTRGGGLVHFADDRPLPDGMTGHPHGVGWFCKRHYKAAMGLQRLSMAAALAKLAQPWWSRFLRRLLAR